MTAPTIGFDVAEAFNAPDFLVLHVGGRAPAAATRNGDEWRVVIIGGDGVVAVGASVETRAQAVAFLEAMGRWMVTV